MRNENNWDATSPHNWHSETGPSFEDVPFAHHRRGRRHFDALGRRDEGLKRHGGPRGGRGGHGGGRGGGFGPRGSRRAGRGDVRLAILSLLAEDASNGYGLIKTITEKTGNAWNPSPGSVYPTLQQLVDEELISPSGDGRRTQYELTDAGRQYVAEHEEEIARAWDAAPGRSEAEIAFHESVIRLKGVIHQFRHVATDEQRAAATEKLDEARRALYLLLAD